MLDRHKVLSVLARVSRRKAEATEDHLSLGSLGLSSSLTLGALRSSLEAEHGAKLPIFDIHTKVGELCQLGSGARTHPELTLGRGGVPRPAAVGVAQGPGSSDRSVLNWTKDPSSAAL